MRIGIITERKNPPDRRVVLSPEKILEAKERYPNIEFLVEESDIRVFSNASYSNLGIDLTRDMSSCDVLLGVKEVPVDHLLPNKTYLFFSHTIKKQHYNRKLLQACLNKNIRLIDHETLVDAKGVRLIGFGRYAGIVGAYNTFRAFGIKYEIFDLPKAETLLHKEDLIKALHKVIIPPVKVVLTGFGKVGNGAKEILEGMKMKEVSVENFLTKNYDEPVYTQIDTMSYYKRIDGAASSKQDFYSHPERYTSDFERFTKVADILIAGHFFKAGSPKILTRAMLHSATNTLKVIGDVSCDVDDGPIDSTLRVSTIAEPFYGYYPREHKEVSFDHPAAIGVMAIDNLPCELPKDASEGFGEVFVDKILPAFVNGDQDKILERATITENGKLTSRFAYLQDFADGK